MAYPRSSQVCFKLTGPSQYNSDKSSELNDLDILVAYVDNTYLHRYKKKKMYTISGPEFSKELEIIIQTIVISLYGSKKSMARFNGDLLDKINIIGFKPSKPDPYLWIRDTGNHHEYISVCYDDLLVFSKNPMGILKYIYTWFTLKVVVRHELYLGGDIKIYNYDTR